MHRYDGNAFHWTSGRPVFGGSVQSKTKAPLVLCSLWIRICDVLCFLYVFFFWFFFSVFVFVALRVLFKDLIKSCLIQNSIQQLKTLKHMDSYCFHIFHVYFHIFPYFLVMVHLAYTPGQQRALQVQAINIGCHSLIEWDVRECMWCRQHERTDCVLLLFLQVRW